MQSAAHYDQQAATERAPELPAAGDVAAAAALATSDRARTRAERVPSPDAARTATGEVSRKREGAQQASKGAPHARRKSGSSHDADSWVPAASPAAVLASNALPEAPTTGPAPPERPPKSAARAERGGAASKPLKRDRTPSRSPDLASTLAPPVPAPTTPSKAHSPEIDSSATSVMSTPTMSNGRSAAGGGGLNHPRPRPQLSTNPNHAAARLSSASSSANSSPYPNRRSGAYFTDESDWTGGPSSALETPSTTADYSASASSSPQTPASKPKTRPPPLPLDAPSSDPPASTAGPATAALAGLGLDFLSPPTGITINSSTRTSFDEVNLDRGLERLSQFASTLPSPYPPVKTETALHPPVTTSGGGAATMCKVSTEALDRQVDRGVPPVPPLPSQVGLAQAFPGPTTSQSRRNLPSLGVTTSTPGADAVTSDPFEKLISPAVSVAGRTAACESETDFFSTDADLDGQTDPDEYDDAEEDSFSVRPAAGSTTGGSSTPGLLAQSSSSLALAPRPQAFVRASSAPAEETGGSMRGGAAGDVGLGLWNEDVPNWEGALPRPGDGVVDWTGCRLERQALPADTTHLILAQCETPLQIAPLLHTSIASLSQTLVVLDIGSCGLTEIPTPIGACCFLEELDIHGNPLATGILPTFLGTLPALNVLLADGCNITALPDSLAQLSRLHTFTLRNNRLRTLPAWISRLTSLEQLLIDGNPFHWQIHTLVQPLLQTSTVPDGVAPPTPASSRQRSHSILSPRLPPPAPARTESSPVVPTGLSVGHAPETTPALVSPPLASPALFRSAAGTPVPEVEQQGPRPRKASFPTRPPTDHEDSATTEPKGQRKWGRLLKKVSTGRLRSTSSASKRPPFPGRAVSQPLASGQGDESDAEHVPPRETWSNSLLGGSASRSRTKSRPRLPAASKRQSFLALKAFGDAAGPPDQAAALKAVLAYLRDLDDLSPDLTLPTIPLDASSPALRQSPSLGALSPGGSHLRSSSPSSLSRASSARRRELSTGSSAFRNSRTSSLIDESLDPAATAPPSPRPLTSTAELVSPSPELDKPRRKDDPAKRAAVIQEIIATEKSYLRGLQELCSIYVASAAGPVSSTSSSSKHDTVVPAPERRVVFGNVEAIRDFHAKILLPDLLAASSSSEDLRAVADQMGQVFSAHVSFMKIYSSYINGFDDALARIQSWAKPTPTRSPLLPSPASPGVGSLATYDAAAGIQSTLSSSQKKRIKSWLKRCRAHSAHSQISLESYLLLPIQRIPRYRLLFGTLASCTPVPDGAGTTPLHQAVRDLEEIAAMLNESKRENEGRAQLIMWQNRLVSKFKSPLVQPHRTLLRSGALTLVRSVKRTTTQLEPPLPGSPDDVDPPVELEEVYTLYTETKEMGLTALLCNDLLVLVKMPPPPFDADPNSPVELYTVLRLTGGRSALRGGHHRAKPPASVDGPGDLLRLKIGEKAVCYIRCAADPHKNRKEALAWASAINLQWEVNT